MSEPSGAERLWQLTMEHSPVGMTLVSPDGLLLSANRSLCTMLGRTEQELRGSAFQVLTHPDDLAAHQRLFDETIAGSRSSYRITKRCVRADGSTLWGDLSVVLLRDEDGRPLHLIGQINDVSRPREDRERLSEASRVIDRHRRTAEAILDTVDLGMVLIDRDGHYEQWNRRHSDFLELAYPEGHLGQAGQTGHVFAADGVTVLASEDMPTTRAVRGEEFDDYRIWVGDDPTTRRALAVSARAVRDPSGAFTGAVLGYSDITDLMRALRSREEFLALVSHELRTPLTSVLGHLELLTDRDDLPPDVRHQLRVVQRNSHRLQGLVADLLLSASRRDGTVALTRSATDLTGVLRDAVEAAVPTASTCGVELVTDLPAPASEAALEAASEAASLVVDRERMRQVLDNLISNALKYTERGGRVEVRQHVAAAEVEIVVTDTGIGIDSDDLDRVFTPFFRAKGALERAAPGAGLGLGIARSIVAAHGGRIEIGSTPDHGTWVRVLLPRSAPSPDGLPDRDDVDPSPMGDGSPQGPR
ncbi:ATP-binding protein [Nocardioides plantarum]|uniref:ATP-binding protein n=1 Tax=Nocardioides plantarum TaxID=29299 RepID=UPI003617747A